MPSLTITATLDLTGDEMNALADTLGCNPNQLIAELGKYAPAALREYVEMFAGQAMTSASELRETRLAAILLALPDFPPDETIARLFSLSSLSARSLLRSTLSHNRIKLKPAMDGAARRFLGACTQADPGGDWEGRCANAVTIEILNRQLASEARPREPIRRKTGTFDTYVVANGSIGALRTLYP